MTKHCMFMFYKNEAITDDIYKKCDKKTKLSIRDLFGGKESLHFYRGASMPEDCLDKI